MRNLIRCNAVIVLFAFALAAASLPPNPAVRVTIDTGGGSQASPMMHGVFCEDINYGADGGRYAELVQNRSFEHAENLCSWAAVSRAAVGSLAVKSKDPLNANNPHSFPPYSFSILRLK